MDTIIQLLDELEEILDNSRAMPFSNKVSVEKEELYSIIAEIRLKLPNELKNSRYVLEERNKILIDAQKEADEIVKNAEERLSRMVEENEITKRAYEQASAIIDASKKTSKEMRLGAVEYAQEVLTKAQDKIKEVKENIHTQNMKADEFFTQTLDVLNENIQELRINKK